MEVRPRWSLSPPNSLAEAEARIPEAPTPGLPASPSDLPSLPTPGLPVSTFLPVKSHLPRQQFILAANNTAFIWWLSW